MTTMALSNYVGTSAIVLSIAAQTNGNGVGVLVRRQRPEPNGHRKTNVCKRKTMDYTNKSYDCVC